MLNCTMILYLSAVQCNFIVRIDDRFKFLWHRLYNEGELLSDCNGDFRLGWC
jgi:hypothetical protein